jgi:hypothetical protein
LLDVKLGGYFSEKKSWTSPAAKEEKESSYVAATESFSVSKAG